jgi:hypothetical protein
MLRRRIIFHVYDLKEGRFSMRYLLSLAGTFLVAISSNVIYAGTVPSAKMVQVEFTGGFPDRSSYGAYHGTLKFADRLDVEYTGSGSASHTSHELTARDPLASIDFQWRWYSDFRLNEAIIQSEFFYGLGLQQNHISLNFKNIDEHFSDYGEAKSITALSLTFFGGFDPSFEADDPKRFFEPLTLQNARAFADLRPESVYATELKLSFGDGTTLNGNLGRYEVVRTELAPVPLPAGVILLSSAIVGLVGVRRLRHRQPRISATDVGVAKPAPSLRAVGRRP